MSLTHWASPRIASLLPLDEAGLKQIIDYTGTLSDRDAAKHLEDLLGDSPQAREFVASFNEQRESLNAETLPPQTTGSKQVDDLKNGKDAMFHAGNGVIDTQHGSDSKQRVNDVKNGNDVMFHAGSSSKDSQQSSAPPPDYAPPSYPPPASGASRAATRNHTNAVIEAAKIRAVDEQEMQNALQALQFRYGIYNTEIEPEHETDYYCNCPIHVYKRMKWNRYGVQEKWSKAVMYPGEKAYNDNYQNRGALFSGNPYAFKVISPYGIYQSAWGAQRPIPKYHAMSIHQTIALNNSLNKKAQADIDDKEPKVSIWDDNAMDIMMSNLTLGDKKRGSVASGEQQRQISASLSPPEKPKASRLTSFRKSIGIKSSDERQVAKIEKAVGKGESLRKEIVVEEQGRWPDEQWRHIVVVYQDKVGMTKKIADLRARHPIQYLHLLRAGYFEPIPVAWATQPSNPLKFSIEAAAGWRGITPNWRGYEDTAEERLYWVLNHREGSFGMRIKPDFIATMEMARARMATAVDPPPEYADPNDICHVQHTSVGYSKQVMPPPFRAFDRPEVPTDDTMILLDVSGSMDFDPVRPNYDHYLITGYQRTSQPKNKDVAKAIIRRFTDAMSHHDHQFRGYDMTTFSSTATYIGTVNQTNLEHLWNTRVKIGGGTRVM